MYPDPYFCSTRRPWCACLLLSLALFGLPASGPRAADVLQTRNDTDQTGANLAETVLTPATVKPGAFGRLFTYGVEGNVFAQPLVATAVRTSLGPRDVVYIVTTDDVVYAFDANNVAQSGGLIWTRRYGNPADPPRNLGAPVRIPYGPGFVVPVGASPPSRSPGSTRHITRTNPPPSRAGSALSEPRSSTGLATRSISSRAARKARPTFRPCTSSTWARARNYRTALMSSPATSRRLVSRPWRTSVSGCPLYSTEWSSVGRVRADGRTWSSASMASRHRITDT